MGQRTGTYLLGTPTGCVGKGDVTVSGEVAVSGTNGIKKADYRFDDGGLQRTVFGTLTGDSDVELYVYPYPGDVNTRHLEVVVSTGSDTFTSVTGTFVEVLNGPFWGIQGIRVGVSGSATALAYL